MLLTSLVASWVTAQVDLIQRSRVQPCFGTKTFFFDASLISISFLELAVQKESFSRRNFHNITPFTSNLPTRRADKGMSHHGPEVLIVIVREVTTYRVHGVS